MLLITRRLSTQGIASGLILVLLMLAACSTAIRPDEKSCASTRGACEPGAAWVRL